MLGIGMEFVQVEALYVIFPGHSHFKNEPIEVFVSEASTYRMNFEVCSSVVQI